jgi:hypothetical protein
MNVRDDRGFGLLAYLWRFTFAVGMILLMFALGYSIAKKSG